MSSLLWFAIFVSGFLFLNHVAANIPVRPRASTDEHNARIARIRQAVRDNNTEQLNRHLLCDICGSFDIDERVEIGRLYHMKYNTSIWNDVRDMLANDFFKELYRNLLKTKEEISADALSSVFENAELNAGKLNEILFSQSNPVEMTWLYRKFTEKYSDLLTRISRLSAVNSADYKKYLKKLLKNKKRLSQPPLTQQDLISNMDILRKGSKDQYINLFTSTGPAQMKHLLTELAANFPNVSVPQRIESLFWDYLIIDRNPYIKRAMHDYIDFSLNIDLYYARRLESFYVKNLQNNNVKDLAHFSGRPEFLFAMLSKSTIQNVKGQYKNHIFDGTQTVIVDLTRAVMKHGKREDENQAYVSILASLMNSYYGC